MGQLPQAIDAPAIANATPEEPAIAVNQLRQELPGQVERQIAELAGEIQPHLARLSLLAMEVRHPDALPLTTGAPHHFYEIGRILRHGAELIEIAGDWATSAATMRREAEQENG
jgi:hypothetical protein